jgi:monoterpene epsilon-lactone hydrolase
MTIRQGWFCRFDHLRLSESYLFFCGFLIMLLSHGGLAQESKLPQATQQKPPTHFLDVSPDGTVEVPAQSVPVSPFLSPEAKLYVATHLKDMRDPNATYTEKGIPRFMMPYLERQKALFPLTVDDTRIGSVHVFVFTPKDGVSQKNSNRVLIDLHGGGFSGCWPGCGLLESMPLASLGKIKVVSIDYREGPENIFPPASEDVATVYVELLKKYSPENIGIYGCSAGGGLTTMSIAWFVKHNIPLPGAIGVFCAPAGNIGVGGDSTYFAWAFGEARLAAPPPASSNRRTGYFSGTDPKDPLVAPINSPELLAKFPPTLIVTGTRDSALSGALYTHGQLVRLGVDAQLHVWEGLFHGFFYNPDVPESQDAYQVMVRFFEKNLGSHAK